jgi:hypothetical protein
MNRQRSESPPYRRSSSRAGDPPPARRRSRRGTRGNRDRGYSLPREKRQVTLMLCVFHSTQHIWATHPVTFDPRKTNDRELWLEIRDTFRADVQKPWRRWFGFKKVMSIVPIAVCVLGAYLYQSVFTYDWNRKNFMLRILFVVVLVHSEQRTRQSRPQRPSRKPVLHAR